MDVAARNFLKSHGMSWEGLDLIRGGKRFLKEMELGLQGSDSSLKMLVSYIDPSVKADRNQEVLVADAGGTNLRTSVVCFSEEGPKLGRIQSYAMPGATETLDSEVFFQELADTIGLEQEKEKADKLGLCFSYPAQITPNRDGRLIAFTKELRVKNAEGRLIGEELAKKLHKPLSITVLNDAVAVLLGLVAVGRQDLRLHSIAMILGTGMNSSYVEHNSLIEKEALLQEKSGYTVINLESGAYAKIKQGTADLRLDQKSANPGSQLMEKMTSGAYLGKLFLETVLLAIEEDYLPREPFATLLQDGTLQTKDLTEFAQRMMSENNPMWVPVKMLCMDQQEFLHTLAKGLLRRAAKLAAINILGIALKMKQSRPNIRSIPLIVEGSTFYGSGHIRYYLDAYLKQIQQRTGLQFKRIGIENVALLGAGLAAFCK